MRNVRLDLCYDGTRYKGWQRLANSDNTIQGKLERTLSRILGEQIEISGSGRTDAGTHAMGQAAREAVEDGRKRIAAALSCYPDEVIFTSGGTEANNLALLGAAYAKAKRGCILITEGDPVMTTYYEGDL